ncbi:MAG TPA: biotin/lipoyl-binding protein, partial [Caulobacteraceae bacterium]
MNPIDEEAVGPGRRGALARLRWPLMIGGPVIILALVAWFLLTGGRFESTDDAYVQVGKAPISAAIAGRVIEVDVKENQHVKAGQVLFKLDPADEVAAVAKADAALAAARLQVASLRDTYTQQRLQVAQTQTTASYSNREAVRQNALVSAGVASRQQAAAARHTADVDTSQVIIARQQAATALANLGSGARDPDAFP